MSGKVMARVIFARARSVPLLPLQHGFRGANGTAAPQWVLKHTMQHARKRGIPAVYTFLDLTKAYDSVPRAVLWESLVEYGFDDKVIAILKAMYDDAVYVRLGGETSEAGFRSRQGVRQGCLLSPLLFNIVLDRVFRAAEPHLRGLKLHDDEGEWKLTLRAYADDIIVFNASRADAQADIDVLCRALDSAGLRVNPKKTKWMQQDDHRKKREEILVLPQPIQILPNGGLLLQLPETPVMACPFCAKEVSARNGCMRNHLDFFHGIKVLTCSGEPQPVERTPFSEDADASTCSCGKYLASKKAVQTHWRKRTCHDTPLGQFGYDYFVRTTPVPVPDRPFCAVCRCREDASPACPVTRRPHRHFVAPHGAAEPDGLCIYGAPIERVRTFKYLGRTFSVDDDDTLAIQERVSIARLTFMKLHSRYLRRRTVNTSSKVAVWRAIVQAQVLFGSETWCLEGKDARSLRSFQQSCLRLCTHKYCVVTKVGTVKAFKYPKAEEVLAAARAPDIVDMIEHASLRFLGHALRRPAEDAVHRIVGSTMEGDGVPGFRDAHLLAHKLRGGMGALGVDDNDARDRQRWRAAIDHVLGANSKYREQRAEDKKQDAVAAKAKRAARTATRLKADKPQGLTT